MSVVLQQVNRLIHETLLRQLGYVFSDIDLFEQALTHRSFGPINNERLEFLGDSLLSVFVAEELFKQFPTAKEGELSRLRSQLVKGETLAELGREFNLSECLILGEGELRSGGFRRASILANGIEALIGAIYLDSDFITCRETVLPWFRSRLDGICIDQVAKDPKSTLQELLQGKGLPLPVYELIETEGKAHEQIFTIQCEVTLLPHPIIIQAASRKQAEKLAAQQALNELTKNAE